LRVKLIKNTKKRHWNKKMFLHQINLMMILMQLRPDLPRRKNYYIEKNKISHNQIKAKIKK
jgi:hypothetical protein